MKRILLFSFCLLSFFLQTVWGQKGALTEVRQVVERVTGQSDLPVSFVLKLDKGANYFQYRVDNGVLKIEGSNPVALCRGFYDFVKSNRAGLYSWSGSNICFPQQLVDGMEKRIVSPFEHHYLFNVCTYGYSMPYWDWERWEKEIDWMVLHGINLPLAITGTDVVWYQVLNRLGYSKEEINSFIAGPAFQAWWLMNNLEGWGGPNPDSWYKQQADLQKKIVKRMCEYGIEPVLPGYSGMVPHDAKEKLQLNVQNPGLWCAYNRPAFLQPTDPRFGEIATIFYEEMNKLYGKANYYSMDPFHEEGSTKGVDLQKSVEEIMKQMKKNN